jgi:hypothetical protein
MAKTPRTSTLPLSAEHAPAEYEDADIMAFKALAAGDANEFQQQRAITWLVNNAARTYDASYRSGPHGDRATAFAEGRRFVGLQIVKMVNYPLERLKGGPAKVPPALREQG